MMPNNLHAYVDSREPKDGFSYLYQEDGHTDRANSITMTANVGGNNNQHQHLLTYNIFQHLMITP